MGEDLNIFIPKLSHGKHSSHIKEYFNSPRIRPMGIGLELTAVRKDNSTFPIEISLSFLSTDTGNLAVAFMTDITTRKKAEDDLKKRNLELDQYAHTVAHDLNSSLTGMVGYSELLTSPHKKISKEKQDSYLKEIAQSGRKMTTIIRELLLFASMKKEDVDIGLINMKEIIEAAIKRLKYQAEEKSAKISISNNILNCNGYSAWIEEIWLNYISNAIKYGGDKPKIEIYSTKLENGFIKYSVKDNGIGLSDDMKANIFNDSDKNNYQIKKGFGLGLSIVNRIVEKLDGYVTVESEFGTGSIFSFYLK